MLKKNSCQPASYLLKTVQQRLCHNCPHFSKGDTPVYHPHKSDMECFAFEKLSLKGPNTMKTTAGPKMTPEVHHKLMVQRRKKNVQPPM